MALDAEGNNYTEKTYKYSSEYFRLTEETRRKTGSATVLALARISARFAPVTGAELYITEMYFRVFVFLFFFKSAVLHTRSLVAAAIFVHAQEQGLGPGPPPPPPPTLEAGFFFFSPFQMGFELFKSCLAL